ncbi:DJ-1/PfpI family protein [Sphingomonas sp.]|uniref:DJ-1/PfpI family protein n=1 Tax=Sphingomonas sp. TaxID=28214 RepID=UPI0025E9F74A|nr:DJ-1/PfpI family protein [Sphingomonas sp.]
MHSPPSRAKNATDEARTSPVVFGDRPRPVRREGPITIGALIFDRLDQIDFTGPFEVFSRIPDTEVHVVAGSLAPVVDVRGLTLTPTLRIADAPLFDVLHVSGGLGQQAIMDDPGVIGLIQRHAEANRLVFSVCTGALLCGAAGLLRDRLATTHWAAHDLLRFYGATPVRARVVVDGNYVSTAGVTAGLDGALLVASLLRGDAIAERNQLDIEYAPEPLFHSGTPEQVTENVLAAFFESYGANKELREAEARRFAERLNVTIPRLTPCSPEGAPTRNWPLGVAAFG